MVGGIQSGGQQDMVAPSSGSHLSGCEDPQPLGSDGSLPASAGDQAQPPRRAWRAICVDTGVDGANPTRPTGTTSKEPAAQSHGQCIWVAITAETENSTDLVTVSTRSRGVAPRSSFKSRDTRHQGGQTM